MGSGRKIYIVHYGNEFHATYWMGREILDALRGLGAEPLDLKKVGLVSNSLLIFPDRHGYLGIFQKIEPSNRVITTWWHGWSGTKKNISRSWFSRFFPPAKSWRTIPEYSPAQRENIKTALLKVYRIIYSCREVGQKLINDWQMPEEKLVWIPISVDLNLFRPGLAPHRVRGTNSGAEFVIGNFSRDTQLDGSPKWVKAPEIFLEVVLRIFREYPRIKIVLTNERRQFLIDHLRQNRISFDYIKNPNYKAMPAVYRLIDLSLITSREEGGPKQLLESMAMGVPAVSTKQGMALDWIGDGENGFLCEIDDVRCLAGKCLRVINEPALKENFASRNGGLVRQLSMENIAEKWRKLISSIQ